jgi:hypothetical protein
MYVAAPSSDLTRSSKICAEEGLTEGIWAKQSALQVEDKGEVRWVSLNRPDTHNAFNELVIGEITDAFRTIQRDAAQHKVRVHIIYNYFIIFIQIYIYSDYLYLLSARPCCTVSCGGVDRQRQVLFGRCRPQLDEEDGLLHPGSSLLCHTLVFPVIDH